MATFRVVDEYGDYYETTGDPAERFELMRDRAEKAEARVKLLNGILAAIDAQAEVDDTPPPIRSARSYRIGSDSRDDGGHWAYINHDPCGADVWTGSREPTNPDVATLLSYMDAHHCLERGGDCGGGGAR